MRIRRIVLVSAITLGLAGSSAAAANASGVLPDSAGSTGSAGQPSACPAPPDGEGLATVQVKDGKVYLNGKVVGTVKPGEPAAVAVVDGKVYTGAAAEALPKPPTDFQVRDGKIYHDGKVVGEAKPGTPVVVRDGQVYTGADAEALPKPGEAGGPILTQAGTGEPGLSCVTEGAQPAQR